MPEKYETTLRWQDQNVIKVDGRWTVDGLPNVTVEPVFSQTPSNIPGFTYIGLRVIAPPHSATPPHKHGGAAVVAVVIRGKVVNEMECDGQNSGAAIYSPGETWYEPPGCHHVRSQNPFDEEAEFIANFVIETKKIEEKGVLAALVQIDADEEEKAQEAKKTASGL